MKRQVVNRNSRRKHNFGHMHRRPTLVSTYAAPTGAFPCPIAGV